MLKREWKDKSHKMSYTAKFLSLYFLQLIRQDRQRPQRQTKSQQSVWLVLGNESCDLDSAVTALVYSLLLSAEGKSSCFVLNVNRADYPLKTEVVYWFNKFNITHRNIIFRDDLEVTERNGQPCVSIVEKSPTDEDLSTDGGRPSREENQLYWEGRSDLQRAIEHCANRPNICLVDHHVVCARDALVGPLVAEVIDHRPLEEHISGSNRRVTHALVGSCCTLVAEQVLLRQPSLLSSVAALLHGCIVLDSVNGLPAAGRSTPRDEAALVELEKTMEWSGSRSAVFTELSDARADVSSLTFGQLLRRDMKRMPPVAVSALLVPLKEQLSRMEALESLAEHCSNTDCRVTVMMGLVIVNDQPCRDLAVYSQDSHLLDTMCSTLLTANECFLQLQEHVAAVPQDSASLVRYFKQGNLKASRKQVMPIIKALLQTL